MQVQHEVRERAMQVRELSAQYGEARAGQFRAGLAIQPIVAGAEFDMILYLEIERSRRTPTRHLDVFGFVLADRRRFMRKIGNPQRDRRQFLLHMCKRGFIGFQLVANAGNLGHDRRDVLSLGLRLPDRPGTRVAPRLQFLGFGGKTLAIDLHRLDGGNVELVAARFQARSSVRKVIAQQGRIQHGGFFTEARNPASSRRSAMRANRYGCAPRWRSQDCSESRYNALLPVKGSVCPSGRTCEPQGPTLLTASPRSIGLLHCPPSRKAMHSRPRPAVVLP